VLGRLLHDPARRAKLARGAVEHAHSFSWDRTADHLLAAYRSAMVDHARQLARACERPARLPQLAFGEALR
jgi:D-inositol-3-phosphate glycosyltransferase